MFDILNIYFLDTILFRLFNVFDMHFFFFISIYFCCRLYIYVASFQHVCSFLWNVKRTMSYFLTHKTKTFFCKCTDYYTFSKTVYIYDITFFMIFSTNWTTLFLSLFLKCYTMSFFAYFSFDIFGILTILCDWLPIMFFKNIFDIL